MFTDKLHHEPNQRRFGQKSSAGIPARRHRGFSLIELMIAIAILGLGMVVAAGMFPVGWTRARDIAEYTAETAITANTHAVLSILAKTDGPGFDIRPGDETTTFAGDLLFIDPDPNLPDTPFILAPSDTRVHAMNGENMLLPSAQTPMMQFAPEDNPSDDRLDFIDPANNRINFDQQLSTTFFTAQLAMRDRVFPPLPPRTTNDLTQPDLSWDAALSSRRFVVSILHKLREPLLRPDESQFFAGPAPRGTSLYIDAREAVKSPRTFDVYYFVLRRPRSTNRYAQQNRDNRFSSRVLPNPLDRATRVSPIPLPRSQDLLFPVPWRVQIDYDPLTIVRRNVATNIPTEVTVNSGEALNLLFLIDMFPVGAQFIDEVNGEVYRVIGQRLSKTGRSAVLTLDREVVVEDLDDCDGRIDALPCATGNFILEPQEVLRTVWVFPPAVEGIRTGQNPPIFTGPQPVVEINIRTLTITPRL